MTIKVLLDASAVAAYCRGSIHVGETISEVAADGYHFAVHETSLAEASLRVTPEELRLLAVLINNPRCYPPLSGVIGWRRIAQAARLYGTVDRGLVGLAATEHEAYILTAHPEAYGKLPTITVW